MNFIRLQLIVLLVLSLACNFIARAFNALPGTPTPESLEAAYIPPGCETEPIATLPVATELALPTPSRIPIKYPCTLGRAGWPGYCQLRRNLFRGDEGFQAGQDRR
jgi:hypothetical protein